MEPVISNGYSVHFEDDFSSFKTFLSASNYSKIFFLTDLNTSEKCLPYVISCLQNVVTEYDIIEVDPGEENKNIDFCIGIWQMLLDFGADRRSLVINVGGGVITDMGGFAASTYKRGIDFVHVPTTLLAQVDASVGGKTGIDLGHVKNIIGTFTQPKGVFISSKFFETLPADQLFSGFAELLKHGLIKDRSLFNELSRISPAEVAPELIYRSIQIKNEVVMTDPFEKGLRKILNFGHTIGHAIESYSLSGSQAPLLHGQAIAIGMICESYISVKINGLPEQELNEIVSCFSAFYPHYDYESSCYTDVLAIMQNDKKNDNGKIGFSLLRSIGDCSFDQYAPAKLIIESLEYYRTF